MTFRHVEHVYCVFESMSITVTVKTLTLDILTLLCGAYLNTYIMHKHINFDTFQMEMMKYLLCTLFDFQYILIVSNESFSNWMKFFWCLFS